jgi:hypothetical protein
MSREIVVALVCNIASDKADHKIVKSLEEFIPTPPSCNLTTRTFCLTEDTTDFIEQLVEFNPDLIVHYGLGQGTFWSDHTQEVEVIEKQFKVPLLQDNHDAQELFYSEKYLYTTFFDIIKERILQLDLIKSRPSKLRIATTEEDLIYLRDRCFREPFGFDTETNFLNPFIKDPEPKLLCYSLAWLSDEEEGWCIPTSDMLMKSGNCTFTKETVLKYTEEILFESPQGMFIHNAAYDLLVLHELFNGKQPKNFMADTMVLLNLFHHANKSAALKENTHLINLPSYKDPIKDWIESQPKDKTTKRSLGFEDVPLEIIAPYAAMDAIAVIRLMNYLKKNMARSLWKFYYMIPHKLILTANELACEGYVLSRDRFNFTKFSLERQISETYKEAHESVAEHVDANFNMGSNQQLAVLLFDKKKLNLPIFSKTKGGAAATGQKALDDLMLFHPFIFKLSKLKKLQKLYSTYSYKGYAGVLNEGSRQYKRVGHWTMNAQYKQTNRTARLASSNFNMHHGIKKKGGNVLTLPAQGSMVKHYFNPNIVAEAENILYDKIVATLSDEDREKLRAAEIFDIAVETKPVKAVKPPKPPKVVAAKPARKQKQNAQPPVNIEDTEPEV